MNHKQKADELIKLFIPYANSPDGETNWINAKQCALIAVEEIMNALPKHLPAIGYGSAMFINPAITEWQQVKDELNRL